VRGKIFFVTSQYSIIDEVIMNFQTKKSRELRQQQVKAENKLWQILRNRNFLELKFRRQHPIKSFIVDFCCLKEQLIIELDGEFHNNSFQQNYDEKRTRILEKLGYTVLCFENKIVFEQPKLLLQGIRNYIEKPLTPTLSQGKGRYTVLSTKKLTSSQREIISNTDIDLVEYNAITIEKLQFANQVVTENAIVTSQNSASVLIESKTELKNVFCVGEKTASLLVGNDYNVVETTKNSLELAKIIVKKYKSDSFVFFCGDKRRKELPNILSENKVDFTENILYKTKLNSHKFEEVFDGILFFSPSGVESYMQENPLDNSLVFCIGNTTATAIKEEAAKVIISDTPSVEDVLFKLKEYLDTLK